MLNIGIQTKGKKAGVVAQPLPPLFFFNLSCISFIGSNLALPTKLDTFVLLRVLVNQEQTLPLLQPVFFSSVCLLLDPSSTSHCNSNVKDRGHLPELIGSSSPRTDFRGQRRASILRSIQLPNLTFPCRRRQMTSLP